MALWNHKGGIQKTSETFNLGYVLSQLLDVSVLVVDADPQASFTFAVEATLESSKNPQAVEQLREYLQPKEATRDNGDKFSKVCTAYDLFQGLGNNAELATDLLRGNQCARKLYVKPVHMYPKNDNFYYIPGNGFTHELGDEISHAMVGGTGQGLPKNYTEFW